MATVLITGSNRGIGLALVRRFLKEGWRVHACMRRPEEAAPLQDLAKTEDLQLHTLDLNNDESIAALARKLAGEPIDLLINNAGIAGERERQVLGQIDYEAWLELFRINTLGPVKMLEALLGNLEAGKHKHVVSISSNLASIAGQEGYMLAYSVSKSALNAAMKGLAESLKERGIRVNLLSPGWVRTDMGGEQAPLLPTQSAELLFENISALDTEDSGLFIGLEGNLLPW